MKVHDGGWNETTDVQVNKGDSLVIGPHPWEGGRWVWSGPNGFTSTDREIRFKNMNGTMSGFYKALHTNASGCESAVTFKVVVDDPEHPFVEPDTTEGDSTTEFMRSIVTPAAAGIRADMPVQVFDLQGRYLQGMRGFDPRHLLPGVYFVKQGSRMRRVHVR